MFASGLQLAQLSPSASASTAFTSTLRTEITRVVVANVTANIATFDLYHDDDGTTYSVATALWYGQTVSGNTSYVIESPALGSGLMMARGASLGVKSSVDQALNFTIYGVTEDVARSVR